MSAMCPSLTDALDKSSQDCIEELVSQPSEPIFEVAHGVSTPCIIYDYSGISDIVRRMKQDIELVPNARLNIALKACHTLLVLEYLKSLGVGCDVASVGELRLAQRAGFEEISATGPAFSVEDFKNFLDAGVIPDIDSLSQLNTFGLAFPESEVGLRIRIPLPPTLESEATFGCDSRFGVSIVNPDVVATIERHRLRLTRLHVHTGQMTPEGLLFKAKYLLAIAEHFPTIHTIDLGGGMFHLYASREKAQRTFFELARLLKGWQTENNREIAFRFEPGGAVLSFCGYLVTEVRAVEYHQTFATRIVTVDSSAWNLAPWHKPEVFVLPERPGLISEGLIAGNTLYEGDFFGRNVNGHQMPLKFGQCQVGDRLLLTAAGAYTMTNARRFNRLPLPTEYALVNGQAIRLDITI